MRATSLSDRDYGKIKSDHNKPLDFFKELRNYKFKKALVDLLISEWKKKEMAPFLKNKIVMLNFDNCYMYEVDGNDNVIQTINSNFLCIATKKPILK